MQSTFETLGGTYRQEGDYLIPNLEMPKSPAIAFGGSTTQNCLLRMKKRAELYFRIISKANRKW